MTLRLNGTTSGYVEIDSAATSSNHTIVLPSSNGTANQFLKNGSSAGTLGWSSLVEDASGRLLVGTAAASGAKVEVVSGADGDGIRLGYAGVPFGAQGPAIAFSQQNNSSAQVITSSIKGIMVGGAVGAEAGILTFNTSTAGAAPTERMRIASNGGASFIAVANEGHSFANTNSTTFTSTLLTLSTYRNTANSTYAFFSCIRQGFGIALQILDSGNVLNANNSYGALSDSKLKANIVDAGSQWSDFKALKVRKYNFKEETGNPTHTQIGLIAQEVEQVSPGLVNETPDRDSDGNDLGTTTKSVQYSVLYMKAVKALQEAMERIETLEAANAALETRLAALEAQQ